MEFFDRRFDLNINFASIDDEIARQDREIAQVRSQVPELDSYISKLESNLGLTVDESEKLVKELEEWLRGRH
jgi:septal ring factor EnvC (AmiA/AmiB activator)